MFASWLRSADVTRVPEEVAGEAKAIAMVLFTTNKQTGIIRIYKVNK